MIQANTAPSFLQTLLPSLFAGYILDVSERIATTEIWSPFVHAARILSLPRLEENAIAALLGFQKVARDCLAIGIRELIDC